MTRIRVYSVVVRETDPDDGGRLVANHASQVVADDVATAIQKAIAKLTPPLPPESPGGEPVPSPHIARYEAVSVSLAAEAEQ